MYKNPNYKCNNGFTHWNRFTWVKIQKSAGSSSKFVGNYIGNYIST